ncbi:MAG TPA: DNA methyltransferase, partial [Haliangium sp.]|nr:DNA methyltransferase [Haliangium sp.]
MTTPTSQPGLPRESPLFAEILDARKDQGELSAVLGERVRQAVEHLVQSVQIAPPATAHGPGAALLQALQPPEPKDIYSAATRMVMRLVVILFAEARALLPRDNPIYDHAYGLTGLREQLDRAAGGHAARLRHRHAAWPRVLGLFRLVYHGSEHEELPFPAYGGGLFEPGHAGAADPVVRALAAFESSSGLVPDDVVHRILELLTRSRVKVRQGRRSTWIETPVDFSDLPSEHIGILYEGLLDFELRRAPADEWFLVRWVGTRKGSGTFYTRPQLAGATVRRTLQPLTHDQDGKPRTPEEILQLRVCDPAMGSGSFLVAALRALTAALLQSVHAHGRLAHGPGGAIVRLSNGQPAGQTVDDTLPVPLDHESFEELLTARLRRHVVERCLYGVDLDPVAVELARLALWIEAMDRTLPFEFLDHKLKCGNALVGCWFDHLPDYPLMAWEREGGDRDHVRFVHHYRTEQTRTGKQQKRGDVWTQAIKDHKNDVIKPGLTRLIESRVQPSLAFGPARATAAQVHGEARAILERMQAVPVHEAAKRARMYTEELQRSESIRALRRALDAWCAIWFWPGDALDLAPTPETLHALPGDTAAIVDALARQYRFFHWELEFPDVFTAPGAGFHAVVGNPPWDTVQPVSREFFSSIDPLYRTYTKQDALRRQDALFRADRDIEQRWITYQAHYKALANWMKHAAAPFGDPDASADGKGISLALDNASRELHALWRDARARRPNGYADPAHPFRHQGEGKPYTHKMFLEIGHALLGPGGRLGFLVPASLYSDNGSQALRQLFFDHCAWTHLYAFQNERFVFGGVHHSFKVATVHVRKGGHTDQVHTRFRLGPGDSPSVEEIEEDLAADDRYLAVPVARIRRFSPRTAALLEVRGQRDLAILEKLHENGVLLGDRSPAGWGIQYRQGDFNMTT